MPLVLGLTLSVAFMTAWHAITWIVLLGGGGIFFIRISKKKFHQHKTIIRQRLIGIALGLLAVVIYDNRILGRDNMRSSYRGRPIVQDEKRIFSFIILDREKADRYRVRENSEDENTNTYFLQYDADIPVESVVDIASDAFVRERHYCPTLCRSLWCRHQGGNTPTQSGDTADPRGRHIFDYDKWLRMRSITAIYYPSYLSITSDTSHIGRLDRVRQKFLNTIQHYYGHDVIAGLIAGMTIGDTSMMSKERQQQFINSSLIHIVAVSGGNIAIVLMILGLLLWWMPFYIRQVILIAGVIMYAVFVGDDSSILRATTMAVLTLLAISSGRIVSIWRLLAYAWTGLLLRNPYLLMHDLGFVLSFCAVAGILWAEDTMKILKKEKTVSVDKGIKKRITDWLQKVWSLILVTSIVPSIGAAIGVTPILMGSTGTMNLMGVIANIIIAAMIPPLTIGGLIVGSLGSIWWLSRLISIVAVLVKRCIIILLWISSITTQYGIYITRSGPGQIIILRLGILLWGWYGREQSRAKRIQAEK